MTTEEIDKAGKRYAYNIIPNENGMTFPVERSELSKAFKEGVQFADKHWQEKTRWKSLETEPPTIFGERVQVILKNKHGELSLAPVYSDRSIEDYLDVGFIEWKEIE